MEDRERLSEEESLDVGEEISPEDIPPEEEGGVPVTIPGEIEVSPEDTEELLGDILDALPEPLDSSGRRVPTREVTYARFVDEHGETKYEFVHAKNVVPPEADIISVDAIRELIHRGIRVNIRRV